MKNTMKNVDIILLNDSKPTYLNVTSGTFSTIDYAVFTRNQDSLAWRR